MSPTSLVRMVMDGTLAITFGAPEFGFAWMFHLDVDLLGFVIQIHAGHRSGRNETENLLVKLFVLHDGSPWKRILANPRRTWMDAFIEANSYSLECPNRLPNRSIYFLKSSLGEQLLEMLPPFSI